MNKYKILVVSVNYPDHLIDYAVHGFNKLGHEIIDFPPKDMYKFASLDHKRLDFRFHCLGSEIPKHHFSLSDKSDFDFCMIGDFYFSGKYGAETKGISLIKKSIADYIINNKIPLAVFNTGDQEVKYKGWEDLFGRLVRVEFIRERQKESFSGIKKPMVCSVKEDICKDYNPNPGIFGFCSFGEGEQFNIKSAKRRMVLDWINNMDDCVALWKSKNQTVAYSTYCHLIRDSVFGLSVRGAGWDSMRYWETPGIGSLLFSEDVGKHICIDNNFIHKKDALFFDFEFDNSFRDIPPMRQLHDLYKWMKKNMDIVMKMRYEGHQKVLEYHTTTKRASYILDCMGF